MRLLREKIPASPAFGELKNKFVKLSGLKLHIVAVAEEETYTHFFLSYGQTVTISLFLERKEVYDARMMINVYGVVKFDEDGSIEYLAQTLNEFIVSRNLTI